MKLLSSFSALSDPPAKSYAPELGRPKGEYRVSCSLPWDDAVERVLAYVVLPDLPNSLSKYYLIPLQIRKLGF